MRERPPLTCVVAPSYQRFVAWCHDEGLNPHSRDVRYIDDYKRASGVVLRRGVDRTVDLGGDYDTWRYLETRFRA